MREIFPTDCVTSSNDLLLSDYDSPFKFFLVRGTANINRVTCNNSAIKDEIALCFQSTLLIIHGQPTTSLHIGIWLSGAVDFKAKMGDKLYLTLITIGGVRQWVESARMVV